ncbi:MAG: methyl-accepting chemotaxis protein [Phycisphaerales bacterium]|jgi:methyl-accepting chemotaxis protein
MFKKMKLATKMGIGFGVLVVISGILGIVGWRGLTNVALNADLNKAGTECVTELNQCASLRKDFTIQGFEKAAGEEKNAAEKWQDAYTSLLTKLQDLENTNGLSTADKAIAAEARTKMPPYLTSFEHQKDARKLRDEAFLNWTKVGGDVTKAVSLVITDVIEPARKAAEDAKNADEIAKWTKIGTQLDEQVFQEFLLLRVNAVFLLATNTEAQYANYEKQLAKVKANLDAWAVLVKGDAKVETVAKDIASYLATYEQNGRQYHNGMTARETALAEMATAAKGILDTIGRLQTSLKAKMESTVAQTNTLMISMAISGIVLGVVLAVLITLSIIKPIKRIIEALTAGSEQVAAASSQVSAASQSLAEGATEQAAGLQETSSSLEEMASMTKQNADNAQQANTLASEARKAADTGTESMSRMNTAIQDIQKSSDETSKIIKVIDEIAFQTNLLALNAAVEAARAGEAGKGFAVVAEEVRNLAMRSAEAAKDTSNMIEESVKNSKNGVDIATEVSKVLSEIVQSVGKTTDLVSEIAAACQEQAQGIDQVNTAIAQMDKVTQQNAANAEESASASEELTAQAGSMNDIVGELVSLVGGAARPNAANPNHPPVKHKELAHSDRVFHAIADGKKPAKKEPKAHATKATSREKSIPLSGDEEMNQFNA